MFGYVSNLVPQRKPKQRIIPRFLCYCLRVFTRKRDIYSLNTNKNKMLLKKQIIHFYSDNTLVVLEMCLYTSFCNILHV